jgi:phenylacetate-CoA ligase
VSNDLLQNQPWGGLEVGTEEGFQIKERVMTRLKEGYTDGSTKESWNVHNRNIHRYISQYCIYPVYETLSGRRFRGKLKFLQESQWWDQSKLKEYQWKRLKTMLIFAFEKSPYYREKFIEFGIHPDNIKDFSDFTKIPLLNKRDILNGLNSFVSNGYTSKDLIRDMTSGSTGMNMTFYVDRNSYDYRKAANLRSMGWYNSADGDRRITIWGSPIGASKKERIVMALRDFLLRDYFISSYGMNDKTMLEIVDKIKRLRPKVIVGYVSALKILAEFIEKNSIPDIQVNVIIPAAETLFEYQRELFERVFHGEVYNRYGSHEFHGIAHECNFHNGMHINAENFYLEVLKDGRPAPPGQIGEIVITNLESFGMPFIRYHIEDLGALRQELCRCGRGLPLLDCVEGRVYDVIRCPNGSVQTGTFFCKLTRSVPGIREFQVIQESFNKIRFKLVTDEYFQRASTSSLVETIKQYCGETMEIDFDLVEAIEPLKSGKRRYIVSSQREAS